MSDVENIVAVLCMALLALQNMKFFYIDKKKRCSIAMPRTLVTSEMCTAISRTLVTSDRCTSISHSRAPYTHNVRDVPLQSRTPYIRDVRACTILNDCLCGLLLKTL